ncbi:MAG: pilus assembly protein TadG-related protein [Deltaproteobacteria bacterium]|nr:pilus assembly protein TadG-related protein [Deltaproteobacteria bacterium]
MHNNRRAPEKLTPPLDESGAVAVYFLLIFSVICGIGGIVIDYGNMVRVRAEVQRTADAAALAGAAGLVPYTNPGAFTQTPNWANGVTKAHTMISNAANEADNLQFATADGTVDYGWWLLTPPTGYVQALPKARPTTAAYLPEPAIKVSVSRNVNLYLAPIVGVTSPKTVSATATAILPEAYKISKLPPIAVSWDVAYDTIKGNVVADVDEQDIKIQAQKGKAGWFNLTGGNSVPSVRFSDPLVSGTSTDGTSIYLVPGSKASLTDLISEGETVVVAVVDQVDDKVWKSIQGFAAFKIDSLGANSMTGHFVDQYFDPNVVPSAGTGAISGVSGTPKLVSP